MKTLSYVLGSGEKEIKIGDKLYFGEITDGDGDLKEILDSGAIFIDCGIVDFTVIEEDKDDILKSIVQIDDINA